MNLHWMLVTLKSLAGCTSGIRILLQRASKLLSGDATLLTSMCSNSFHPLSQSDHHSIKESKDPPHFLHENPNNLGPLGSVVPSCCCWWEMPTPGPAKLYVELTGWLKVFRLWKYLMSYNDMWPGSGRYLVRAPHEIAGTQARARSKKTNYVQRNCCPTSVFFNCRTPGRPIQTSPGELVCSHLQPLFESAFQYIQVPTSYRIRDARVTVNPPIYPPGN